MADGSVVFTTELDAAGIKSGLDGLRGTVNKWGAAIVGSKAFAKITDALISVTKAGIEYNAQMEAYQTNFGVLLGDQAAALEHVAELREMAAKTPFGMEDLANASQTLLSFGVGVDDAMNSLQMLGDISLGNKERFSSLALAFAQVSSAGKLTGQDLLQMVNAGFNPLNTIAEKTGTNIGDLKEFMAGGKGSREFQKQMTAARKEVKKLGDQASEGARMLAQIGEEGMISAEMVGLAMQMETSQGGRFYNGMEMASQTMSGLFSTLKDDALQLAGNVFEPLSNVLTDTVLPAAIGAVGAMNALFEKDGTLEISAETQEAVDKVNALETQINTIKQNYAAEAIKIKVEYEESMNLISELESLQIRLNETPVELWSETDQQQLAALTAQLIELNPQLKEFVGDNGVLDLEAQKVRDLVTEYKNLAIAKAAQAASEQAWQVYFNAEAEAENLRTRRAELEADRQAAIDTGAAWTALADNAGTAWDALTFKSVDMIGLENMTGYVETAMASLQSYVELAGGIDPSLFEGIDLSAFFDGMNMLSAEEIMQSSDAMSALGSAMEVVGNAAIEQESIQQTAVDRLTADLEAGDAAVESAEETAAEALASAQSWETTVTNIASGVASLSDSTAAANTAIDGVKSNAEEMAADPYEAELKADDQASEKISSVSGALTDLDGQSATVYVNVEQRGSLQGIADGSHADGLDYVPYDNYLALLHKGEQVLTAEEAAALRQLSSGDYASRLASRTYMGSSEQRSAGVGETIVNQTINFNQPVQTPDEFAKTMKLYATYGLTDI